MKQQTDTFKSPPELSNAAGDIRRVGFELEFTGLPLEDAVSTLASVLNARAAPHSAVEWFLDSPDLGRFRLEMDWGYLKRIASEARLEQQDEEWVNFLKQTAQGVVPLELVCPAIPITELDKLSGVHPALRNAGAKGTDDSLIAAFGLHINSETPALNATTIHRYLCAFCLLQWWLLEAHQVSLSRRVSTYIALYPEAFCEEILASRNTDMSAIFDCYLRYNPTRNRALDLLPVLAAIDPHRVARAVDDARIRARPAFHYRLPNCQLEQPAWSLASQWNIWIRVEQLAADSTAIDMLTRDFLHQSNSLWGINRSAWVEKIEQWLLDQP